MRVSLPWPALKTLISDADASKSLDDLRGLLDSAMPALGFAHYALVHHVDFAGRPRGAIQLDNYPDAWKQEFISQRYYADDPVHVACATAARPFFWRELPRLLDLSAVQQRRLDEARGVGLSDGLTVPVHVPGDFSGSCSFAVGGGAEVAGATAPAAQFFGCYVFEVARRLARAAPPAATAKLSQRQLDCLILVARGKSDADSAFVLGISRETVHEHVEAAKAKLRVATRTQLVARALYAGHITYADVL